MNLTRCLFAFFLIFVPCALRAADAPSGKITGTVVDQASHPIPFATVTLKSTTDQAPARTTAADDHGAFSLNGIPFDEYKIFYAPVGASNQETAPFRLDAAHAKLDIGKLVVVAEPSTVKMDTVRVSMQKEAFYNSIDRKVYNVGKDLQSANGTASDLMQNIPSVQVDIDGNVSLRGSDNVLILIDGKPSTLMGANRAAVLEQMSADTIDKIEVITNPSAKYKPDGTAGIINIVTKRKHDPGYSGVVRAGAGTDSRYSASFSGNYNPGKYNFYGTYSLRQDDRLRKVTDHRTHVDSATGTNIGTQQSTIEHSRPLSHIAQTGVDYKLSDDDKLGAVARYNYRSLTRHATETDQTFDAKGNVAKDYDRVRVDPEYERDAELKTNYQHSFAKEGEELNIEAQGSDHKEQEDNHYSNVYRSPVTPTSYDNKRITQKETANQELAEYTLPMDNDAKFESGYTREARKLDSDHFGTNLDPVSNSLIVDPASTNRFIYKSTIHSLYGTFGRPLGQFGFLAGLRLEEAYVDTNPLTSAIASSNNYFRFSPTLHLSYHLTETSQLQLNYSRRVRRPEGDDLNPYPEYQDPFNLRAGNPNLLPQDIHSFETGYQYKKDNSSYLGGVYFRHLLHGFTDVTRYINSTTLLTTKENLATNDSGGIELAATHDIGPVSVNFSSNIYYSQIDASNLGFSSKKSTTTWDAKFNGTYRLDKATLLQFNTNFTAKRLTPQGYRYPTYIANLGLKHDFSNKKVSVVLTVADLFNSLKERNVIDTPGLHDDTTRRRSSRILYVSFIYNLGKTGKKPKDDSMQFDSGTDSKG